MSTAVDHTDKEGAFKRKQSKHRFSIKKDSDIYKAEPDRYHLHIALACPWANGVLATVRLKGLEHVISHSIVHPTWGKTKVDDPEDPHHGWLYRKPGDEPMTNSRGHGEFICDDLLIPDQVTNAPSVRAVYEMVNDTDGPFTTPLLWDKKSGTIVSNESTDIMRMINDEFDDFATKEMTLYPESPLAEELQKLNDDIIYPKINNGVYRCGFAKTQKAYDTAVHELFDALQLVEDKLSGQRFLGGNDLSWLDLRLFMTLVRFDPVYTTYFKTNIKRLVDYPNLLGFTRDVYQSFPEIRDSISMSHIKTHYFTSHPVLNTYGIIPRYDGPDLTVPSGRDKQFS